MKRKLLILGIVLAMMVAMVIPASAMAATETATVTGESLAAYTINTSLDFGQVVVGSTTIQTGVLVAGIGGATVSMAVQNSSGTYVAGRLVSVDYNLATVSKYLITAPGAASSPYILTPPGTDVVMAVGESWDLTAIAGAVPGVWDPVVITLTIN